MSNTSIIRNIRLEPIIGPATEPMMVSSDKPFVIGRQSNADGLLTDSSVSRRHATISFKAGTWLLADLQSYHGTYLNGVRLNPSETAPMHPGDLVRIGPWTFRVGGPPRRAHLLSTSDDVASTVHRVQRVPAKELSLRAQHRLELLIDCAASISAASSEQQLAEAALAALVSGTGFPRAAFIRRPASLDGGPASGQVEVVAMRGPPGGPGDASGTWSAAGGAGPRLGSTPQFSRSLVQAAADGQVARLDEQGVGNYGQSVVQLGIQAALCAPIMLDGVPEAFLYLDARRSEPRTGGGAGPAAPAPTIEPDAPAFCQAVARISALALASLKRADLATRQKQLEADLNAAREAQRLIMPPFDGEFGPFSYSLRSKPGRFVAGDLIDLFDLPGGRVAVFLGDVSGKGVEAAILMATAQAHLNASLMHNPDPARAVTEVNKHVCAHVRDGRFITLWVGVLDPATQTLTFVDAGHGYCVVRHPGGEATRLDSTGGLPVGVHPDTVYPNEHLSLRPGTRLILYSDGLVEQQSPTGEEFGLSRVIAALPAEAVPATDVATLFDALLTFAAPPPAEGTGGAPPRPIRLDHIALADDVTIASIRLHDA